MTWTRSSSTLFNKPIPFVSGNEDISMPSPTGFHLDFSLVSIQTSSSRTIQCHWCSTACVSISRPGRRRKERDGIAGHLVFWIRVNREGNWKAPFKRHRCSAKKSLVSREEFWVKRRMLASLHWSVDWTMANNDCVDQYHLPINLLFSRSHIWCIDFFNLFPINLRSLGQHGSWIDKELFPSALFIEKKRIYSDQFACGFSSLVIMCAHNTRRFSTKLAYRILIGVASLELVSCWQLQALVDG